MLKALLRKQFLELNAFYFQNRKTGRNRSKAGTVGFIALYIVLFIGLALTFFAAAQSLAAALIPMGYGWLYYALMGLLALAFGIFGSVFNTYAGLYHAKDNELLLSMPIPPGKILLVRMIGVYAMGMLYTCLIMVPTIVAGQLAAPGLWPLVSQILLTLLLGLVVLTLTCLLGWIVALISAHLKNKSIITALLALAFLVLYYFVYFRVTALLRNILEHADDLGRAMRTLYPIYAFGRAAEGDVLSLLAFAAIALALSALCVWIMARSFIRIVTMNRGGGTKKSALRADQTKNVSGVGVALLRKELRRFVASPSYMLNCGLGLVIMVAAAVAGLIKLDAVRGFLSKLAENAPEVVPALPIFGLAVTILLAAMNPITAPSISLEGKSLWLLQSLPVRPADVLTAKLRLHQCLSAGPIVIFAVVVAVALRMDFSAGIFMTMSALLAMMFLAAVGLTLNLKRPSFNWTNETVPIKQSMPVFVTLFGGWLLAAILVGVYYALRRWCGVEAFLIGSIVFFALLTRLLNRWLTRRGAAIFAAL